ncbi:hypothetical protein HYS03_01950 [Candidatus Woesebacteria bacterium]|nr:hypothetical protein [Candidatus Woesebacteria bacterium]QQG47451.1 MAG: hypothetical protein HY044_05005 [Candidatus Woesebacteria bacterium]
MNLNFRITKTSNLFHFISNLTNWHFSVRPSYKRYWLEKTGPLTKKEEETLQEVDSLFKKYNFGPNYWGHVLLTEEDEIVWEKANKKFGAKDTEKFRHFEKVFSKRFEKIWTEDKNKLTEWKKVLERSNQNKTSDKLIETLNSLFGKDGGGEVIDVILLLSTPNTRGAGGGNLAPRAITLEVSQTPDQYTTNVQLMLWHELVHVIWEKGPYQKTFNNFHEKLLNSGALSPVENVPLRVTLNEAVMESLLPYGYLGYKYFNYKSKDYFNEILSKLENNFDKNQVMIYWRVYSANKLFELSQNYCERGKAIDKDFLEKVVKIMIEFINKRWSLSTNP